MEEIVSKAFDSGHVDLIHGAVEEAERLLNHKHDFIFFTGIIDHLYDVLVQKRFPPIIKFKINTGIAKAIKNALEIPQGHLYTWTLSAITERAVKLTNIGRI